MDIRIRETLFVDVQGAQYVVRAATLGVERKHVIHFFDTTKTVSVAFPKQFCLESPLFYVVAKLEDKEVSLNDVLKTIDHTEMDSELRESLKFNIKSLV